ncbi:hypothetical protein [Actinophytocola sp.]|uniref:hypothetical protein n=1 Tax=Actinophytocola sp. TaxID=1872138 RepID=UPI002ED69627
MLGARTSEQDDLEEFDMEIPAASTPIVCDMTTATDTEKERLAEYRRLFAQALAGKERTDEGIRFRFRVQPGVEAWVRDLAAREKACCAFYTYTVAVERDEVLWDCAVPDDDMARAILDEFYALPDLLAASPDVGMDNLRERFARHGLAVITDPAGPVHTVQPTDRHDVPPTGADARLTRRIAAGSSTARRR